MVDEVQIASLDLNQPALLTLWSTSLDAPKAAIPMEIASLTEALKIASSAISDGSSLPWITTICGLILSPSSLSKLTARLPDRA